MRGRDERGEGKEREGVRGGDGRGEKETRGTSLILCLQGDGKSAWDNCQRFVDGKLLKRERGRDNERGRGEEG